MKWDFTLTLKTSRKRRCLLDYPRELRGPRLTINTVVTRRVIFAALEAARLVRPVPLGNILLKRFVGMSEG